MNKNYIKIVIDSLLISVTGVFVVDYFSHLLFSNPMETILCEQVHIKFF